MPNATPRRHSKACGNSQTILYGAANEIGKNITFSKIVLLPVNTKTGGVAIAKRRVGFTFATRRAQGACVKSGFVDEYSEPVSAAASPSQKTNSGEQIGGR